MKNYYDIVISGGGMIGSILACHLARNPVLREKSILLIEASPKKMWNKELAKPRNTYSNRVSALSPATKSLIDSLGLWDTISGCSCCDIKEMKVWGSSDVSTTFENKDLSGDALAYIVENNILIAVAMKYLEEIEDHVHTAHEKTISEFVFPKVNNEENVILRLNDGVSLECSLLLGADGHNSAVRRSMGVQYLNWNYNQKAVIATLRIGEAQYSHTAWQRFIATGPIALLPLSDGYSSLVWSTTPTHSEKLMSLPADSFVDALNSALWEESTKNEFADVATDALNLFLSKFTKIEKKDRIVPPTVCDVVEGSRASFPVGFGHSASYVAPRVALLGDAAHKVHPLAGQGVNLGFGDVQCLSNILTKTIFCGSILGDLHYLRYYETERQRSNFPRQLGIDLIQKIAGHTWPPFMALTNAGFQITEALPALKKYLMKTVTT